jgi:hypothetical protein
LSQAISAKIKRKAIGVKLTLEAIRKLSTTKANLRAMDVSATIEAIVEYLVMSIDEPALRRHLKDRKPVPRGRFARKRTPKK